MLRLHAGDEVALFDGSGDEARVRLEAVTDRARRRAPSSSGTKRRASRASRVHLYQSITKGERFEWLLEKGTEIGVARFVPLIAARAVVKTAAEGNRADRWRRIVVEAAEQCGRGAVPAVDAPQRVRRGARVRARASSSCPYEVGRRHRAEHPRRASTPISTRCSRSAR